MKRCFNRNNLLILTFIVMIQYTTTFKLEKNSVVSKDKLAIKTLLDKYRTDISKYKSNPKRNLKK